MAADNRVEILLEGKDNAGTAFTSAAAQAKAFQAAMDSANRSLDKSATASRGAADAAVRAETAFTKAERAERFMDAEAARASKIQSDLESALGGSGNRAGFLSSAMQALGARTHVTSGEMENLAVDGEKAASNLQGVGPPMAYMIGAGVALAPVIATLAVGLGGLGLAAYGVIKPIETAAQKAGGLRANMAKLDPEQRQVAQSLLSLRGAYDGFQQALKPTVLADFNAAIGTSKTLLRSIEPVAQSTGQALQGAFGQLTQMFASGEWQHFFGWMAQNAGPDIKLLTQAFISWANALPPLLQDLNAVGTTTLRVAAAAGDLTRTTADAVRGQYDYSTAATNTAHRQGILSESVAWFNRVLHDTSVAAIPGVTKSMEQASGSARTLTTHTKEAAGSFQALAHPVGAASGGLLGAAQNSAMLARNAAQVASATRVEASAVAGLTAAFVKGLTPLENYIGATITQKNDEVALQTALKASGDRIGLNTQKQRDSFSAAQKYIQDIQATGTAAVQSHQGIDAQIRSISSSLPMLDRVTGKTAGYNAELAALRGLLAQLRAEKAITDLVTVVHRDVYTQNGQQFQQFHASGGIIGAASGGARGGLTWVGEQGPELVRLPTGSMVYPSGQSKAMAAQGGGGGDTYNISVSVPPAVNMAEVGRQITTAIREFERSSGKGWRTP